MRTLTITKNNGEELGTFVIRHISLIGALKEHAQSKDLYGFDVWHAGSSGAVSGLTKEDAKRVRDALVYAVEKELG